MSWLRDSSILKHDTPATIESDDVECVLADVDSDDSDPGLYPCSDGCAEI